MRDSDNNKKWLYLDKILCMVLAMLIFLEAIPFSNTFAMETDAAETETIQSKDEEAAEPVQGSDTFAVETDAAETKTIQSEDEQAVEPLQAPVSPAAAGTGYINEPLGGNTIASGDEAKLVVMEADGDPSGGYYQSYPIGINASARTAALQQALWELYQINDDSISYIMYIGSEMSGLQSAPFANSDSATSVADTTFASLSGRVDTLVLTGTQADGVTDTPATAANTSIRLFSAGIGNKFFGCNIIFRNIRYNLNTGTDGTGNAVFMNGYDLTLGGNSWQTASSQYFGGSNTGTVKARGKTTDTATITVYSTGNGASYFYGGMQAGTLDGNTEIKICNTSGNAVHFYGGGYGTSAANTANVTGNVTNTITGMSDISGGLTRFIGGMYYGNIGGKITNTISGPGRFTALDPSVFWGDGYFIGGSYSGDIGSDSTLGSDVNTEELDNDYTPLAETSDYVIKNNIDTSGYTSGRMFYIGINFTAGIVKGNIVNILKAGANNSGSYSGVQCGGGYEARIGGSWATANNFSAFSSNGTVKDPETGIAAAKSAASFQIYGNITNVIRSGSISTGDGFKYFRGAGYGYVKGNAYSAVGTDGIVYQNGNNTYEYSTTIKNQSTVTTFDLVGGGGAESGNNSFCIIGDTTLVLCEVRARWTYGGSFGGVHIGDSKIELHSGVVSTLEGAGYNAFIQKGDSRAEVYGGQVDSFLCGGSWNDTYHDGNVSVEVFDGRNVIINASMGGTYGLVSSHYTSGDSEIVVHGGNFSGTANRFTGDVVENGFSAGPSYKGTIFGNASVTLDLRGNQSGFSVAPGDRISGGRRYGTNNDAYLGTDENNTITLNILTDNESTDLLNGLSIYGDCSYNNTTANAGRTRSGHITININAPNANLGSLFATSYPNTTGTNASIVLMRDVQINLVSAGIIQGLSGGNGNETITNTIAAYSGTQNKYAVINVGPQSTAPEDILGDKETGMTADGLPHKIRVTGGIGITGFTSMDIRERLLIAEDGSIKNGGTSVTLANHDTYSAFGNITLHAGDGIDASGIGVAQDSALFIAGVLTVEGDGTAYIQSPGTQDQIVFTDATVNADYLTWLKVGNQSEYTNLQTNCFGARKGWFVFTLNPSGLTNAKKMTPDNLRGVEAATGKTFAGDNDTRLSVTDGYAVAISALIYTWEVTEGEGMISHNVEASTSKPSSGYMTAYSTVTKDTPSAHGMIAIPCENIPSLVVYPELTFIPDAPFGEWVKGIQIHRSDEYIVSPQHLNCTDISEQSISDYKINPTVKWAVSGEDKYYTFDIKAQYTSDAQLTAHSVIITEAEAAAITGAADIINYNQAEGRPFSANNITDTMITAIQKSLDEGQYMRIHPVIYTAGDTSLQGTDKQTTVDVIVVKDETGLSGDRSYGVYAGDAVIELSSAQMLSGQSDLDNGYTHAIVILADGTTATPTIDSAAVSTITSTTFSEVPKDVPVTYTYAPDVSSTPVEKNVVVRVVSASITIEKYGDKSGGTTLTGAEFTIERWDSSGTGQWIYIEHNSVTKTWSDTASGNSPYTQITAGTGGSTTFAGLPLGKYRIKEVASPTNYTILREPIITEVPYMIDDTDPNYDTVTGSKSPDSTVTGGSVTTAYYYNMTYTITDTAVINMPATGRGITPVMLVLAGLGIALLASAGYILFSKRRRTAH